MTDFSHVTDDDVRKFAATLNTPVAVPAISRADAPFHCPPDTVLDLPLPPSVNRLRRINWAAKPKLADWKRTADNLMRSSAEYKKSWKNIERFELDIILDEARCKIDPDNICKAACDYLKRIEIIQDDAPKNARQITIKFGRAPEGMRIIVRPLGEVGAS